MNLPGETDMSRAMIAVALTVALIAAGCGSGSEATVTRTVTLNSRTCVQGYRLAGRVLTLLASAFRDAAQYTPLVEQAAVAGTANDVGKIRQIAKTENAINAKLLAVSSQVRALDAGFHPSPEGCQ